MSSEYKKNVLEFCGLYPEKTNTEIANKIARIKEKPEDIEKIRTLVRYYRGVNGSKCRNKVAIGKAIREKYYKRFSLPKPIEYTDYSPLILKSKKTLVLADIHIPDHATKAITLAIKYGHDVDTVILLGDVIDGYQISKFSHDPGRPSLNEEIKQYYKLIEYINQELPNAKIVYKAGNHDGTRLQTYLYRSAPEISNFESLKLENLLECKKYDVTYVPDMRMVQIGKLLFLHGHELGGNPSCNIARSLYLKVNKNIMFGHFHRIEEYTDVNSITRETKGSYAVGCLSNTQPDYRPYSKFIQGFAVVTFKRNGEFEVDNKIILNNKIV